MEANDPAPFVPPAPPLSIPSSPRRLVGSTDYSRLWMAQVVSSLGDWIGLVAILALAARVSGGNEAAVGLIMAARMLPGFFLAPVGGVLVDRWDRKKTLVTCDLGRGVVVALLPFVDTLLGLFLASFLLELLTLLWSPAKDASIPNLVPPEKLAGANSLSMAAAYGTFPVGSLIFASLAGLASFLSRFDSLSSLDLNRESLALWVDAATYGLSALLIATVGLPRREARVAGRIEWGHTWRELKAGLRFVRRHPVVRSVMLGIGVGLVGCGAVIPLGPIYADDVLGAGSAGFGLLMTGLGFGGAIGVLVLSTMARRLPTEPLFVGATLAAGLGLVLAASVSTLTPAVVLTGLFGFGAGVSYVSGFTMLQERVSDEMRGRTFATLYTIIRFCLLLSLALSPWLAGALDELTRAFLEDQTLRVGFDVAVPGVRVTLWLGGLVTMAAAGVVARDMLRRPVRQ